MPFMNQWDIEEAQWRYASHPILGKATRLLYDLMQATNAVSDGWHSWPKPCRAANKLITLIERGDLGPSEMTEADLRKAVAPIKALLTRHATTFAGQTITLPT